MRLRDRCVLLALFFCAAPLSAATTVPTDFEIREIKLTAPRSGWLLTTAGVLRTADGGSSWVDVTPGALPASHVHAAYFADDAAAWTVVSAPGAGGKLTVSVAGTPDGGRNWGGTALPATEEDRERWSGDAFLTFSDAQHGWALLKRATSAAFNWGILFRTSDGGRTWERLGAAPAAAVPAFVSPLEGWLAGTELWKTVDGGRTWSPAGTHATAREGVLYEAPVWSDRAHGRVLGWHNDSRTAIVLETDDGGATWSETGREPRRRAETLGDGGAAFEDAPGVMLRSFLAGGQGWIVKRDGGCGAAYDACWQNDALLATGDGGRTSTDITPPAGRERRTVTRMRHAANAFVPAADAAGGNTTTIYQAAGFDKASRPPAADMDSLRANSSFQFIGTYLGGSNFATASYTRGDATWMTHVSTTGWGIIPTWVGPQPNGVLCNGHSCNTYISTNLITAASQGRTEADSAASEAAARGIPSSIIYYDLEGLTTTGRDSTIAFVSAWVGRLHELDYKGGVYSHANDALNWKPAVIANPPDAVWIVKFYTTTYPDPPADSPLKTVWGLDNLPDNVWSNLQRIRQTSSTHYACYNGNAFCFNSTTGGIDSDWAEGTFARTPGSGSSTGTIHIRATLNGNPWSGTLYYSLDGTAGFTGSQVPADFTSMPSGGYTATYQGGGPGGTPGIDPPASLQLNPGGSITWTFRFTGGPICSNATPTTPAVFGPGSASSGSTYTISWTATSTNDSYDIQESVDGFATATTYAVNGTSRSFNHNESSSKTYWYRVRAKNSCGETSAYSSGVTVLVSPSCQVPPAPTSISGPYSATSLQTYSIGWSANNPDATYQIQESTDGFITANTYTVSNVSSYAFSHYVSGSTTYAYRVRALSWCNYASGYSSVHYVTVSPACNTPVAPDPSVIGSTTSGSPYQVVWNATSPDNLYDVEESGQGTTTVYSLSGTAVWFSHTPGAQAVYSYRVRARASCGNVSPFSYSVSITISPACNAPSMPGINAPGLAASGSAYTVTWDAYSPAGTYELQEATEGGFWNPTTWQVSGTSKTFTKTVSSPVTFYYRVRALTSCGLASPYSASALVTVQAPACTFTVEPVRGSAGWAGGTFQATVSTNGATCSWSAWSNSSFMSVISGGGSGSGTVRYTIGTNATGAPRSGSLTIAGITFPVRQVPRKPAADFDLSGTADLVLHDAVSGETAVWLMNGSAVAGHWLPRITGMQLAAVVDADGDGRADLLWRNPSTGQNAIWLMNGGALATGYWIPTLGAAFDLAATGDFNADGYGDLVWRNRTTGAVVFWFLGASRSVRTVTPLASSDVSFRIAGAGDLDGDGRPELILRKPSTGYNAAWFFNEGGAFTRGIYLPAFAGTTRDIAAVDDFDGDGRADLFFRDTVSGANNVWFMSDTVIKAQATWPSMQASMHVAAFGDYDGDGFCDLAWHDDGAGLNAVWLMSASVLKRGAYLPTTTPSLKIVGRLR